MGLLGPGMSLDRVGGSVAGRNAVDQAAVENALTATP